MRRRHQTRDLSFVEEQKAESCWTALREAKTEAPLAAARLSSVAFERTHSNGNFPNLRSTDCGAGATAAPPHPSELVSERARRTARAHAAVRHLMPQPDAVCFEHFLFLLHWNCHGNPPTLRQAFRSPRQGMRQQSSQVSRTVQCRCRRVGEIFGACLLFYQPLPLPQLPILDTCVTKRKSLISRQDSKYRLTGGPKSFEEGEGFYVSLLLFQEYSLLRKCGP